MLKSTKNESLIWKKKVLVLSVLSRQSFNFKHIKATLTFCDNLDFCWLSSARAVQAFFLMTSARGITSRETFPCAGLTCPHYNNRVCSRDWKNDLWHLQNIHLWFDTIEQLILLIRWCNLNSFFPNCSKMTFSKLFRIITKSFHLRRRGLFWCYSWKLIIFLSISFKLRLVPASKTAQTSNPQKLLWFRNIKIPIHHFTFSQTIPNLSSLKFDQIHKALGSSLLSWKVLFVQKCC